VTEIVDGEPDQDLDISLVRAVVLGGALVSEPAD